MTKKKNASFKISNGFATLKFNAESLTELDIKLIEHYIKFSSDDHMPFGESVAKGLALCALARDGNDHYVSFMKILQTEINIENGLK